MNPAIKTYNGGMVSESRSSKLFAFMTVLALSGLLMAGTAYAQDPSQDAATSMEFKSDPNFVPNKDNAELASPFIPQDDEEITVLEDKYSEEYVGGTIENLSQLYWRLHVFDETDDNAVDNFLMINECEIYNNFSDDDFEWQDIREAGRAMLKEKKAEFPVKFKFLIPVDLSKYDPERGGFDLISGTAFDNMRRIEISANSTFRDICGYNGEISDYPRNIILILNKPFDYDFLELDEHVAQAFILRKKYETESLLPRQYRGLKFERPVFIRIRVTFSQYQGNIKGRDGLSLAVLYGRLDGIDIFEDPAEKQLLTSIDYPAEKSLMNWKRDDDGGSDE